MTWVGQTRPDVLSKSKDDGLMEILQRRLSQKLGPTFNRSGWPDRRDPAFGVGSTVHIGRSRRSQMVMCHIDHRGPSTEGWPFRRNSVLEYVLSEALELDECTWLLSWMNLPRSRTTAVAVPICFVSCDR